MPALHGNQRVELRAASEPRTAATGRRPSGSRRGRRACVPPPGPANARLRRSPTGRRRNSPAPRGTAITSVVTVHLVSPSAAGHRDDGRRSASVGSRTGNRSLPTGRRAHGCGVKGAERGGQRRWRDDEDEYKTSDECEKRRVIQRERPRRGRRPRHLRLLAATLDLREPDGNGFRGLQHGFRCRSAPSAAVSDQ